MCACSDKLEDEAVVFYAVDKQPIGLDVALSHIFIISRGNERVVSILFWKRLLVYQECENSFEVRWVASTFESQLIVLFELSRKLYLKH